MSDYIKNETLDNDGNNQYSGGLPSFLNVLTILTFIGSGLGIIGGLYGLTTIDQQKEAIQIMENMPGSSAIFGQAFNAEMTEMIRVSLDNIYLLQGSAILLATICIIGAIQMRKLKKSGYLLYVISSAISIVIPMTVFGFGIMSVMMMAGHLFTVAFVVMYSVNLKYLN